MLVLALGLLTAVPVAGQGRIHYVNGTDPTCAYHAPCYASIQRAVDAAQPGDRVVVQPGRYLYFTVSAKNATSGATELDRIVIEADAGAPRDSVEILGGTHCSAGSFGVRVRGSRFVTVRGLKITTAGYGVRVEGGAERSDSVTLERLHVRGACSGIFVGGGSAGALIVAGLVHGGGHGVQLAGPAGGPHQVINTTIHGGRGDGIRIEAGVEAAIVNTLVTANGATSTGTGAGIAVGAAGIPEAVHLLNNLVCGNAGGEIVGPALDATDSDNRTPTGSEGRGVVASPTCVQPSRVYANVPRADGQPNTTDDFLLGAASPALDAGTDPRALGLPPAFAAPFEADFAGRPRPANATGTPLPRFDVGAFETHVPDVTAPSLTFRAPPSAHVRGAVDVLAEAVDETAVSAVALTADGLGLSVTLAPLPPAPSVIASATWLTDPVADGAHTLAARATDTSGNTAAATLVLIADNTPPSALITAGPPATTRDTTATFVFAGTDNLTPPAELEFAWRLDGAPFTPFGPATTATLVGLAAGPHTFEVTSRDRAGNEAAVPATAIFTVGAFGVSILSPADGAILEAGWIVVRGTIDGGVEAGVTVNGETAATSGGTFVARVPVSVDTTELRAVATSSTGSTAAHTVALRVTPAPPAAASLDARPLSGTAPLTVTFALDGDGITRAELDADGDGRAEVSGSSLAGASFTYTRPGVYVATAAFSDASGAAGTASAVIHVLDAGSLDALLRAKWTALRAALQAGDVAAATELLALTSRSSFQAELSALAAAGVLSQVAADLGALRMVKARSGVVEYEVRAERNGVMYSFPVVFVLDVDGVWRIWTF